LSRSGNFTQVVASWHAPRSNEKKARKADFFTRASAGSPVLQEDADEGQHEKISTTPTIGST
jgi:hypothetical protein